MHVSEIAYGAMTLAQDKAIKHGVAPSLLRALEQGVTLIDTARVYPGSEELIAATLREWQGPRPLISTKLQPSSRETFRFHRPMAEAYTPQTHSSIGRGQPAGAAASNDWTSSTCTNGTICGLTSANGSTR